MRAYRVMEWLKSAWEDPGDWCSKASDEELFQALEAWRLNRVSVINEMEEWQIKIIFGCVWREQYRRKRKECENGEMTRGDSLSISGKR